MPVFQAYSQFYDRLYEKKDYPAKESLIRSVIKKMSPIPVKNILSLGCGTCSHDILLAKNGYHVTSLDQSTTMLSNAQKKIKSARLQKKITLHHADVRRFSLNKKYDFAMAMFNVIGYQVTNSDLTAMLQNVSNHLKPGGLFLFDCWYAPAVIADPPTDRIKEIKAGKSRIIRLTQSSLLHRKNQIQIKFHVFSLTGNKKTAESEEIHHMRYLSLPEIDGHLEANNLHLLKACPFLKLEAEVSDSEWDMFIVAAKKK